MNRVNFRIGDGKPKGDLPPLETSVEIGLDAPLFVMAVPCVIESKKICLDIASRLVEIGQRADVGIIFKASFEVQAWKMVWTSLQRFVKRLTCLL